MLRTFQEVIDRVRQIPSLSSLDDTLALKFANEVLDEVGIQNPQTLYNTHADPITVNVSTGVKDYVIGANDAGRKAVSMIESVVYKKNAQLDIPLKATTITELAAMNHDWRSAATGDPQFYYFFNDLEGKLRIGLHPSPDATTANNFPRICCWGAQRRQTTYGLNDSVPESIGHDMLIVYGIAVRVAETSGNVGLLAYFRALFNELKAEQLSFAQTVASSARRGEVRNSRSQ